MPEPTGAVRPMPPFPVPPPPPSALRWVVLAVLGGPLFAGGYLDHCIGPLAKVLSTQLGFSNAHIGLLQAMVSVPSLVMVLVGGIVIDRIGTRRGVVLFSALCLAGSLVTTFSPRLGVMAAGRLVYGLGSGSLSVAVSTATAKWFRGPRLGFAYGLSLTLARIGSLAAQTGPAWAGWAYRSWRPPLVLALGVAVLGLAAGLAYAFLERRARARYDLGPRRGGAGTPGRGPVRFGPSYWLVVLVCATYYAGVFPFQTFAQKFFIEAHRVTAAHASELVGIPTVIAMAASPLFGLLADRIARRARLLVLGTALMLPIYLLMAYAPVNLAVPMVLMGISFALVPTVLWPAVMVIAPRERLGTAFGLMQLVQSIGLVGFNCLIGWANDACGAGEANPAGYRLGMWLFTAALLGALGLAMALCRREPDPYGHLERRVRVA